MKNDHFFAKNRDLTFNQSSKIRKNNSPGQRDSYVKSSKVSKKQTAKELNRRMPENHLRNSSSERKYPPTFESKFDQFCHAIQQSKSKVKKLQRVVGIDLLSNSFTFDQEKSNKQYLENYFERKSLRSSVSRYAKAGFSETLHSDSSAVIQQSFALTRTKISPGS